MPLPGGPADKYGNRYEALWTVLQLTKMLNGEFDSVCIEDPAIEKVEFYVNRSGRREHHQTKHGHTNGKWTLSALAGEGVLQAMYSHLKDNDNRFIFVSGSDAADLRELSCRALDSQSFAEFNDYHASAKKHKTNFSELQKFVKSAGPESLYHVLRRVQIQVIDIHGIKDQILANLRCLFLTNVGSILDALVEVVSHSTHQTIVRDELDGVLRQKGFIRRNLSMPADAKRRVHEATKRYVDNAKKTLICGSLIHRPETSRLLEKIEQSNAGEEIVITGNAGAGKTGCVIEFVEALQDRKIPVLAFRLDRLESASSTIDLGMHLEIEESPVFALSSAAARQEKVVLVIDQLDAISAISGRNEELFHVVELLVSEARVLRSRLAIFVVVVCREFDLENDKMLRGLFGDGHEKINMSLLPADDVKGVLAKMSYNSESFLHSQLELLRSPQNLSLFLSARFNTAVVPQFVSSKQLFDHYWREKRAAVNRRVGNRPDQWDEVIYLLCKKMTESRRLFLRHELLDGFDPDYISQMASEGVLSFDGTQYGFGHDSFFDYCFARRFVAEEKSLLDFLISSEQHLFIRAQVRQVLAYMRGDDMQRYCREVQEVLSSDCVRLHIKDLVLAIAFSVPDPNEEERDIFELWLNKYMESVKSSVACEDKFIQLVSRHYYRSESWFGCAIRMGRVADWLASGSVHLINFAVSYLCVHQKKFADEVARLLHPYLEQGEEWQDRMRQVALLADFEGSRLLYELFLELIKNGTFDETDGRANPNDFFWASLHGLAKKKPGWVSEALSQWLIRRFLLAKKNEENDQVAVKEEAFATDRNASAVFEEVAALAPEEYVKNIFPLIMSISDAALERDQHKNPKVDTVWSYFREGRYESAINACLNCLAKALESLAKSKPEMLGGEISELESRSSCASNFLLLRLFTANAEYFATKASGLICEQPWRLECGYVGNRYWIARKLIEAISKHSVPEECKQLLGAVMNYSDGLESKIRGEQGRAAFELLSDVPREKMSEVVLKHFLEFERKFKKSSGPPMPIEVFTVVSPIESEAGEKMDDQQWLGAIAKYPHEDSFWRHGRPLGGARQLSEMLKDCVVKEPERFARLCLRFPADTNSSYPYEVLVGLKESKMSSGLIFDVCRKVYRDYRNDCGRAIADLIGSVKEVLPDDVVQMLIWLATEHPDPESDLRCLTGTESEDSFDRILVHGINVARGRAAEAMRDLINFDDSNIDRFRFTLDRVVQDKIVSVRACVASVLLAVFKVDEKLALHLFQELVKADDRLLATHYVEKFINRCLRDHFDELQQVIERMLRSEHLKVNQSGARLISIAALIHPAVTEQVDKLVSGNSSIRLGIAQVAAANIAGPEHRAWCEQKLLLFFNDDDQEVRRESATCFSSLEDQELEGYEELIELFCNSRAFDDDSMWIFRALENASHKLPGVVCNACEKFFDRFSAEARDIRKRHALGADTVSKLIIRTYNQHRDDKWAPKCLDLVDRLCIEGADWVKSQLEEFER